ncbi:ecto-ADP-ribosyltransferase 5-like [Hoplias malabaricus]|uniref:ecto-ADP-ribosyltransferase 5-like n=1 Tax=Hoplias malabaricus TaxID=27720 RepID=UPI0034633F02
MGRDLPLDPGLGVVSDGVSQGERYRAGVGIFTSPRLAPVQLDFVPVNERVTSIRLRLAERKTFSTLGQRSMIDFVIVSSDLRPYILDTWVKRGAELSTDHHLVAKKAAAVAVAEAKSGAWKEFGEAMENDFRAASKRFWKTLRQLRRGRGDTVQAVLSKDGETLNSTERIVVRWKEHFEELLNPRDMPPVQGVCDVQCYYYAEFLKITGFSAVCGCLLENYICVKITMSLICAFLFLLTTSLSEKKVSGQVFPLDMADNSVDDCYNGCREDMNKLVVSKYSEQEKKNTPGFSAAWESALIKCNKNGLGINQSAAIYMYTQEPQCRNDCSYTKFNIATSKGSEAYKSGDFQFYTLHFFLTDAIQQLKRKQKGCVTTFRRTRARFVTNVLNRKMRFGSFTSTSTNKNLIDFGEESCFKVKTCFGAAVDKYSAFPGEQEVLIPPYEVFLITAIKEKNKQNNLWCNVVYELESVNTYSNLCCAKITNSLLGSQCSSSQGLVNSFFVTALLIAVVLAA